ncbi:uncharacterized protein [Asterias amurensis]|uniref:uncharacterized protein n=1 Tax=Asterias amurensis TaxID=7602 RepID=UPI003AB822D9
MAFLTQNETSSYLRDKERTSKRFRTNLEAIIDKYDRPFVESDVLDLSNMTVVEDRGSIGRTGKIRIGTIKLAADKVSPNKATPWDSTKDSTDSAFGSRISESEDTSGTETLVNYTYHQNPKHVNKEERAKAVQRVDDELMSRNSHSEDSGNEDVESDCSGPISTPTKSSLKTLTHRREPQDTPSDPIHRAHQRARGNLSKRFEDEHRVKEKKEQEMIKELSENNEDEEEEEEEDPYEFKDELPSILEERNRFLFKMQSILADSFSDGDGVDEMDSSSEDEASAGTIQSSEAMSGSISAWSTLQSRTTPKRTSKLSRITGEGDTSSKNEDIPQEDERLLDGLTVTSTDSDYTDCSTILAGNLHSNQQLFRPSNLLSRANQNRDSRGKRSQPPFEAICNSTMLSEIQPPALGTAKRKPQLDLEQHRELELPLDGQGEMCLGVVPFSAHSKPEGRCDDEQSKSPKSERSSEFRTPVKYDDANRKSVHSSLKSNTPTTRNHNRQDSSKSPSNCDVSGITPRARQPKLVTVNSKTSLSSPRFNTQEIMEIFRSPKPLIIPGINLDSLDLTPRRRVRREGSGAPSPGPLTNALLRLQSPSLSKEEKSTGHRSQTAKEIIIQSNDFASEMTLDCLRFDSESNDDQRSETSDDGPYQIARTPKTPAVVEIASHRKHQREVVEAANIARPEVKGSNRHLKEGTREIKTMAPTRKEKSVSKGVHISTRQIPGNSNELLNVPEQHAKHSEVCGADLRVIDSQIRRTAHHHRSSWSTDTPDLHTDLNSVNPKSDSRRTPASITKQDARRKHSEQKPSATRQSPIRTEKNTGKKSMQKSRHLKENSAQDVQDDSKTTPLSPKTSKVKRSILTPTVQRSPSTLSSPLNRMSLASPLASPQLPKGSDKKTPLEQAVRKKQKKLSEGHPKTRLMAEHLRLNDRQRASEEFNQTHMTIRDFDDDSEDEMEVDVDPYSLTADDSSPGPSHFSNRRAAHSYGKPAPMSYNDHRDNSISSKDKLSSSKSRASHLSQKSQEHDRVFDVDTKTQTKRYRHQRQSESYRRDLRNSENDGEFGQSSPFHSKREKVLANKTVAPNRTVSKQGKNNSDTTLIRGERKLVVRAEQTLDFSDFSDEESDSSGDSAKFLSLVSNHSIMDTYDSDPAEVPVAVPEVSKRNHVGSFKTKHKTIIRCGQIISSPKSTKSIARNLHSASPPRTGRVEKSRKMYANSPTRAYQSDTKSVRSSTKVDQRGSPAKTVARRLIASPMKKFDESGNVGSLASSPLRSSGCSVSSSYMCEGPGHCTKPFCFSCALSELS